MKMFKYIPVNCVIDVSSSRRWKTIQQKWVKPPGKLVMLCVYHIVWVNSRMCTNISEGPLQFQVVKLCPLHNSLHNYVFQNIKFCYYQNIEDLKLSAFCLSKVLFVLSVFFLFMGNLIFISYCFYSLYIRLYVPLCTTYPHQLLL